ncbi:taste receptor type 2 member 42-like [Colossoma macropomum]|uniref:taste receptor type 2 member 42-like n=1 Tax=Colossoma macropomum TaxID=42526 RepID=UPI001864A3DC|nr:taste receptor type 2 member 42-like [Colossoma macropomum]
MVYNYSYLYIAMSARVFAKVNMPLSAVSLLLNIFFIYCMVFPQQGAEQLKRTLKVLLGSLIACNITIHSSSILTVLCEFVLYNVINNWYIWYLMFDVILAVMMYTMMTIVTSCHWKNMFYFCQIVRLQHSVFIWFKRNIRAIINCALILNAILFLFGIIVELAYAVVRFNYQQLHNASDDVAEALWNSVLINRKIRLVDFWTRLGCFFLSLCVMLASSYATVLYLWRHIKNVEESGLVSPRLQRQIKMTITGITVQALLHFLCSDGIILIQIIPKYYDVDLDWNGYIICTIISVYSFGTSINMMVSQSLFRQRAVCIWQKLLQTVNFSSLNN